MGERDLYVGTKLFPKYLLSPDLMGGVHVAKQERDCDRPEAFRAEAIRGRPDPRLIQRLALNAVRAEPPVDLDDVGQWHKRFGFPVVDVVEARAITPRDVIDMACSRRCEKHDAYAAPLQECVDTLGCAVDRERDVLRGLDDLAEARHDALGQIMRRRGRLPHGVLCRLLVIGNDVCERTADIHRHAIPRHVRASYCHDRGSLAAGGISSPDSVDRGASTASRMTECATS